MRFKPPHQRPYVVEAINLLGLFEANAIALDRSIGRLDLRGDELRLEFNDHDGEGRNSLSLPYTWILTLSDGSRVVTSHSTLDVYLRACGQSWTRMIDNEQAD